MRNDTNRPGVYQILCTANGRVYVGSANKIAKRWEEHRNDLRANRHHNQHLQRAWNKYGDKAFEFSVLENCDTESVIEREQYYLNAYLSAGWKVFNIRRECVLSNLGVKFGDEAREHMRASAAIRSRNDEWRARQSEAHRGKKLSEETRAKIGESSRNISDETRAKMSESRLGKSHSEETRAKIAASNLGQKRSAETCAKVKAAKRNISDETRAKMSAAARNRSAEWRAKWSAWRAEVYSKPFEVVDPDGRIIEGRNLRQFCREHGLDRGALNRVLHGKVGSHKGYTAVGVR